MYQHSPHLQQAPQREVVGVLPPAHEARPGARRSRTPVLARRLRRRQRLQQQQVHAPGVDGRPGRRRRRRLGLGRALLLLLLPLPLLLLLISWLLLLVLLPLLLLLTRVG